MYIESVKLSPKKGGNGYLSSFTFNIGSKEAAACGLVGKRTIKIVDESKGTITFKAKHFTVTPEIVNEVIRLRDAERKEESIIDHQYLKREESTSGYYSDKWTVDMGKLYRDEYEGKVNRPQRDELKKYLFRLPIETLADLVLLMYIGRDYDVDLDKEPGEERFIDYYDYYSYIVVGSDPDILTNILMEKYPMSQFLETGLYLLNAPKGSDIDELLREKKAYD